MYDTIIVGAGAIGLGIGWKASELGLSVLVVDDHDSPGGAASRVAAGMLAPITEVHFGEEQLLEFNLLSAKRYPSFLEELGQASEPPVELGPPGTIFLAINQDQREALLRLYEFQRSLGLNAALLTSDAARDLEPALHPSTRAGILATGESAIDPVALTSALAEAARAAGGELRLSSPVKALLLDEDRCRGVILETGEELSARQVVLASGVSSGLITGAPPELAQNLRPVKGQILRLSGGRSQRALLTHVIRTEEVYLVPRPDGELVVGATVEEKGFDSSVTAGGILDLLEAAEEAVPGIREFELVSAQAGLRPATPDNAPIIGRTSIDGVIAAAGHYRNGILQTPITADTVATLLAKDEEPTEILPFSPRRFTGAAR
jgi:glycine oxidase